MYNYDGNPMTLMLDLLDAARDYGDTRAEESIVHVIDLLETDAYGFREDILR